VAALWLRSIAVGNLAGAEPAVLQVDITRDRAIDDNAFQVELATIVENSFNIHQDGSRMLFREEENPRAKLMAYARNDRLFSDGSDQLQLAKQVRYVVGGSDEVAKTFRVIALPKSWQTDPWSTLDESERPEHWDGRLPILVLPEEPERIDQTLGRWLKDHLQQRRNTVRFLLPRSGLTSAFLDRDLLILARAVMKAQEWGGQDPEYRQLHREFEGALRDHLKRRFDRFAVLRRYDHQHPQQSLLNIERLTKQGAQIPEGIEDVLTHDLFVPEDFEELILAAAAENAALGKIVRELQEPRPAGRDCIPWLGETAMKERILRLCAHGKIAINLRGLEYLQAHAGEDEESAWRRMRPKLSFTGRQLDEVFLIQPSAVQTTGGTLPEVYPLPGSGGTSITTGETTRPVPTNLIRDGRDGGMQPSPSGIFGDGGQIQPPRQRVQLTNPPTSSLNLIGKLEEWGVGPATPVAEVSIRVSAATGAQLKEMLKKLPDGMTFALSLEKEKD
jgi:predicted transcriptional regulator